MCDELGLLYVREDIARLLEESRDGFRRVKNIVNDLWPFSHADDNDWHMAGLGYGLIRTIDLADKRRISIRFPPPSRRA